MELLVTCMFDFGDQIYTRMHANNRTNRLDFASVCIFPLLIYR